MSPDTLDDLRDADPARRATAAPEPDWDAMAARITASPRRRRLRRAAVLVPALAGAAAAVAVAAVALRPAAEVEVDRPPAAAAPAAGTIYHYVGVFQELEGPGRRPVPGTDGRREGWLDPATGELRELSAGTERTIDAQGRTSHRLRDGAEGPLPAAPPGEEPRAAAPDGTVLTALVRPERPLEDRGLTTFEGRRVRSFVFENAERTMRHTYLVDAQSRLPVLVRIESGEHLRTGAAIPEGQRVIEERFETFEALPGDTDRAVLSPSG